MNGLFDFVVRRLRWLIGVPLFPQFFDSLLLAWTFFARPPRIAAREALEAGLEGRVTWAVHRFGGLEFRDRLGRELGHVHGHGLLDVRLACERARRLVAEGRVQPHHTVPHTGWVSLQLESVDDVPFALSLLGIEGPGQRESRGNKL